MLRITKLVPKVDLFTLLNNPDVAKVEMLNNQNATLKNPYICRVQIYLRINKNDLSFLTANCEAATQRHETWQKGHKPFVTGICSIKQAGFIKWSAVQKLANISNIEGVDFGIPKSYQKLVAQFDNYTNG